MFCVKFTFCNFKFKKYELNFRARYYHNGCQQCCLKDTAEEEENITCKSFRRSWKFDGFIFGRLFFASSLPYTVMTSRYLRGVLIIRQHTKQKYIRLTYSLLPCKPTRHVRTNTRHHLSSFLFGKSLNFQCGELFSSRQRDPADKRKNRNPPCHKPLLV